MSDVMQCEGLDRAALQVNPHGLKCVDTPTIYLQKLNQVLVVAADPKSVEFEWYLSGTGRKWKSSEFMLKGELKSPILILYLKPSSCASM